MAVIRVEGLRKRYGDVIAVNGVDLEVERGEVVGLLGPSGCGKTTTLRSIAGLEKPSDGVIELAGRVVDAPRMRRVAPEKRNLGMVFQSYALWPHMTVHKNVEFALDYASTIPKDERVGKVRSALEAVGLEGLDDRYPGQLSGGQQQRVAVARAIVAEPSVLLFDEPLSNLDAKLRNRVRIELRMLLRRLGATTLYVTHDQKEAMALCDRIAVMSQGVIRQIGTPEEVYGEPADTFVASFVGDTNILPASPVASQPEEMGSRSTVRLAGQDFLVEQGGAPDRGGYAVLRPEDLSLHRARQEGCQSWDGEIIERLYLGAFVQYLVALRGTNLQVTLEFSGDSFAVGEPCVVVPRLERLAWIPDPLIDNGADGSE